MCGIIAAFNTSAKKNHFESANDFIINQYEEQFSRGTQGFGIIRIDKKMGVQVDRATEPTKFLIDLTIKKSDMIIAHHRTPTSTKNKLDQTHPILVSNKQLKFDYLVIHNGIITNTGALKTKHKELGYNYTTEYKDTFYSQGGYNTVTRTYDHGEVNSRIKWNDTESLAVELALFIEGKIDTIENNNNAAFIVVQINKKTQKTSAVFFGRNGMASNLNMYKTKGVLRLSSEGIGEEVEENQLFAFNPMFKAMYLTKKPIPFTVPEVIKEIPEATTTVTAYIPNLKVDSQTAITPTNIAKKETTEVDESIRPRGWNTLRTETSKEIIVFEVDNLKGYVEEATKEMEQSVEKENSRDITHIIDDTLDSEIEKIGELVTDLKDQLLNRTFGDREEMGYSTAIHRMIRAMRTMTDAAETEYLIKRDMEITTEAEDINQTAEKQYGFSFRNEDEYDDGVLSNEDWLGHNRKMEHQ